MRQILAILALALSATVFAQDWTKARIDWEDTFKTIAIGNHIMDAYQTMQWDDMGVRELNPVISPLIGSDLKVASYFAVSGWLLYRTIESAPDRWRTTLYGLWAVIGLTTVRNNHSRHGIGFPVYYVSLRF